ncbi:hypothetical protein SK128_006659 [Halocaridina rubra]|uniref:Uncharacterized protein n=1 Tax=Halocaridina rubra TaxID=373956 RepID=A0AAN9A833_HALRR
MDHPSMVREKKFEVLITKNEETFKGSIILDIFARPEDKITGQLESTIMSRNSIRMEAKLAGRPLRSHPKLILSAAYDSHTFGFDLQFEKEHQARPSLVISAKYDRITEMNAAMGLIVKTEGGPVVEISAAMKPDYEGDCSGVKISALAHSALTGKYDTYTKLCKPGYVKLYVKKHGQDKAYITRFGLEEIKNLEVSLTEKDVRTQEYKFLALARLRLMSPTVVNIEGKLESEQAYGVWVGTGIIFVKL